MQCYEIREDRGSFSVIDAYSGEPIQHQRIRLSGLELDAAVHAIDRLYEMGYENDRTPAWAHCIAA